MDSGSEFKSLKKEIDQGMGSGLIALYTEVALPGEAGNPGMGCAGRTGSPGRVRLQVSEHQGYGM